MNTAFNDERTTAPRRHLNQELKDMSNNNVATKAMRKAIRKSARATTTVGRKVISYSGTMFSRIVEYKPERAAFTYTLICMEDSMLVEPDNNLLGWCYECALCGEITVASLASHIGGIGCVCPSCLKYITPCEGDGCNNYIVTGTDAFERYRHHVELESGSHGYVCTSCYRGKYVACAECGTLIRIDRAHRLTTKHVCERCYAELMETYVMCRSCGRYVAKDTAKYILGGSPRCPSCYLDIKMQEMKSKYRRLCKPINGYSHSDGRIFVSTEGGAIRYYGLELEADNGIEDTDDQSEELLSELSPWVEFMLKSDGSINGFETVSVPLTLNYIRDHLRLKEWCDIMKRYEFNGDSPDNHAGMHVHISRAAFGDSERKRNRAISAFLYLFNRREFRSKIKVFSRRRGDFNYCSFYDRAVDYSAVSITRALPLAIAENRESRNRIINFHVGSIDNQTGRHTRVLNEATVEVRLFKGSLRMSTIVAAVELIDLFADIAISKWTEASLRAMTWADICKQVPATSVSLKSYLKRHDIWGE